MVDELLGVFCETFQGDLEFAGARSSRGHVYAARNLMESVPEVKTVWRCKRLESFLREQLGDRFGLVRALFFDKPPDRTWNLPWHKDTSVAVKDNSIDSASFSRPTTKAGVPHFIACDDVLRQMLTLRIHLDEVTDENGPLRVIPGSHVSSASAGVGVEGAVTIHASIGDVLAMRPLISHASGPSVQGTRRHRRILHLEFAAQEKLPDGVMWHDFVGRQPELSSGN
jgi:Phytanoyl-CoA dioxygenase (PhyH)